MNLILAFIAGAIFSAVAAYLIASHSIKSRTTLYEESLRNARQDLAKAESVGAAALAEKDRQWEKRMVEKEEADTKTLSLLQSKFDEAIKGMSAQLKIDTTEILKSKQEELAKSNKESLGQVVDPLKERLESLKEKIENSDKEQARLNGQMGERIKNLMEQSDATRKSAEELANALKHGSKVQGDWGEQKLDELLSSQGLIKGIHYDIQETLCDACGNTIKTPEGKTLRPDVIIHLDKTREVIIDSKVSLTSYIDYVNATTESEKAAALKSHIESIKKHIKELAAKDYSSYIKPPKQSAGYVIMFVPIYGALWSALNEDTQLWRKAADMNVYMADEQSLYSVLRIVNLTWQQIAQAQNHQEVYDIAHEIVERVALFKTKYEHIGKSLGDVQKEYDECMKRLDDRGPTIINSATKLIRLGTKNSEKHPLELPED